LALHIYKIGLISLAQGNLVAELSFQGREGEGWGWGRVGGRWWESHGL
jgi:hypothetical protein